MVHHMDFAKAYVDLFDSLGTKLGPRARVSEAKISAAEKSIGKSFPLALREYYLVCGGEKSLNRANEHLLSPDECFAIDGRIGFMAENQCVCYWAVSSRSKNDNPAVSEGYGDPDDEMSWNNCCSSFTKFMATMLHLQAVNNGFKICEFATFIDERAGLAKLKTGWTFVGELKGMKAYNRDGNVICLHSTWMFGQTNVLQIGAKTKAKFDKVRSSLNLGVT